MKYRINFRSEKTPHAYVAINGNTGYKELTVPWLPSYQPIADMLTLHLPDELQEQLVQYIQLEKDIVKARQQLLETARESFHQTAVQLTADLLNTNPELFI